jgi:hypothetical protein
MKELSTLAAIVSVVEEYCENVYASYEYLGAGFPPEDMAPTTEDLRAYRLALKGGRMTFSNIVELDDIAQKAAIALTPGRAIALAALSENVSW